MIHFKGEHIQDGLHDLGEDIHEIGEHIKNDIGKAMKEKMFNIWKDQGLVDIVVAAALPGST